MHDVNAGEYICQNHKQCWFQRRFIRPKNKWKKPDEEQKRGGRG